MKTLSLDPICGLCNRIRTISSAIALADHTGRRLKVYWHDSAECHTTWNAIFEAPKNFDIIEVPQTGDSAADGLFSAKNPCFFDSNRMNAAIECCDSSADDVAIRNFGRFFQGGDYRWFRPAKSICEELEAIEKTLPQRRLGIHIRRTDNMLAIFSSPTKVFVDAVQKKIDADPQAVFFLATDNAAEKRLLLEKFPNRIFVREKVSGRFENGGIRDALIDPILLSRSTELFGSVWSSFSVEAATLGGIPITVLEEKDKVPVSIVLKAAGHRKQFKTCLDALAAQWLWRVEILCSLQKDSEYREIYQDFVTRDDRFKLVPSTEDIFAHTRGKYTAFLTSTSVPLNGFSKSFFENGERSQADIVICKPDFFEGNSLHSQELAKKLNDRLRYVSPYNGIHRKYYPGVIAFALFWHLEPDPFFPYRSCFNTEWLKKHKEILDNPKIIMTARRVCFLRGNCAKRVLPDNGNEVFEEALNQPLRKSMLRFLSRLISRIIPHFGKQV